MNKQEFLLTLQDTLQSEAPLRMDMPLKDIPEWDSMAAMATIALADRHFNKRLRLAEFKHVATVEALYDLLISK